MAQTKKKGKEVKRKHFKFGVEMEFFTLDEKGYMTDAGDRLIKLTKEAYPHILITKECGKNMIEIVSSPDVQVSKVMEEMVSNLESVLSIAEKEKIILYPYATYPGSFTPTIQESKDYKMKQELFGKQRFSTAARCVGLHCHYTLPWGVFDAKVLNIKNLVNSKNKQSLVNIYNLFIAMDPALTTFTQSSPFYQGKFLGKDARVIVYRGGEIFNYPQGLYANYETFGALQPYKSTATDLLDLISKRFTQWEEFIEKFNLKTKTFAKHGSILDTTWNPVKINAHGTMEHRGMDINTPRVSVAVATLIKYITHEIQEHRLHVVPSDIGVKEPFKVENGNIFIPPDTHVRKVLQPAAAFKGLEDEDVYRYASGLLRLAKLYVPESRLSLLVPLDLMLKERKTTSDYIIDKAKAMGINLEEEMSNSQAAELALSLSHNLYKDLVLVKQTLRDLAE
jgi:hypothetical protein